MTLNQIAIFLVLIAANAREVAGDGGGWEDITPTGVPTETPSFRFDHAMTSVGDVVYLFGGWDGLLPQGDLWAVDLASSAPRWEQINVTAGDAPVARYGHGIEHVGGGTVLLFGGTAGKGAVPLGDAWTLQRPEGGGQHQWQPRSFGGEVPSPRRSFGMACSGSTAWLFGGNSTEGLLADLYSINVREAVPTWRRHAVGAPPPGMSEHGMSIVGSLVFVVGGPHHTPISVDTAEEAPAWRAAPLLPANAARFSFGMASVGSVVWVFGGGVQSGTNASSSGSMDYISIRDFDSLDAGEIVTPAWVQHEIVQSGTVKTPTPRRGVQHGLVRVSNSLVLFGGIGQSSDDTKKLWRYKAGPECPAGAYNASLGTTCSLCSPGRFSLSFATRCSLCRPGSFSDGYGVTGCALCPSGTFSRGVGAVSRGTCEACRAGTYSGRLGAAAQEECVQCPENSYGNAGGVNSRGACEGCAAGTVSGGGATMCRPPWGRVGGGEEGGPRARSEHAVAAMGVSGPIPLSHGG